MSVSLVVVIDCDDCGTQYVASSHVFDEADTRRLAADEGWATDLGDDVEDYEDLCPEHASLAEKDDDE